MVLVINKWIFIAGLIFVAGELTVFWALFFANARYGYEDKLLKRVNKSDWLVSHIFMVLILIVVIGILSTVNGWELSKVISNPT